jgi:hypothetical protein
MRPLTTGLLPRGDHGSTPGLTLGDAAIGALGDELGERALERLVVERDVWPLLGGGGDGRSGRRTRRRGRRRI